MFTLSLIITSTYILTTQSASVNNANGCSITLPKSNDILQPVVLINRGPVYDFAIPDGNKLYLQESEPISLLCPPSNNRIGAVRSNLTSVSCYKNEIFKNMTRYVQFKDINCTSYVKASIETTNKKCGNNIGTIINIGYQTTNKQFLTLITTCFDAKNGNTLYTNHTVHGQAVAAISQQSFRPPFSEMGLPRDLKANDMYKQKNQKITLENLLGSNTIINDYYSNNFLARGHLSADADFVYAPLQFATYFFINVCPQWQSINGGNWLAIESMIRKTAKKLRQPLQVFTGTYDILTLPDYRGNPVEIYIGNKERIPVPKYLWKIIYNKQSKEGIAFIAINNPFLDYIDDTLCPDVCDDYNWSRASFGDIKKGYVYCCDVSKLRKVVNTIPFLQLQGVLKA